MIENMNYPFSHYYFDDLGNPYKLMKKTDDNCLILKPLKTRKSNSGYRLIHLYGEDGSDKVLTIGRCVIEAFNKDKDLTGLVCDHINGKTYDDRLSNLLLISLSENLKKRKKYKLNTPRNCPIWVVYEDETIEWYACRKDLNINLMTLTHMLRNTKLYNYKKSSRKYGIKCIFYDMYWRIPDEYRLKVLDYSEKNKMF